MSILLYYDWLWTRELGVLVVIDFAIEESSRAENEIMIHGAEVKYQRLL